MVLTITSDPPFTQRTGTVLNTLLRAVAVLAPDGTPLLYTGGWLSRSFACGNCRSVMERSLQHNPADSFKRHSRDFSPCRSFFADHGDWRSAVVSLLQQGTTIPLASMLIAQSAFAYIGVGGQGAADATHRLKVCGGCFKAGTAAGNNHATCSCNADISLRRGSLVCFGFKEHNKLVRTPLRAKTWTLPPKW